VRRRSGRKRALGTRALMAVPQGPNQRWSLDFVSDALTARFEEKRLHFNDGWLTLNQRVQGSSPCAPTIG
jgi:hypothetical protein